MRRRLLGFSSVLASLVVAGSVLAATVGAAGSAYGVKLDPSLRVHPYLQYGAQVEPGKKVRVIVEKASAASNSRAIAAAVGASVRQDFAFIHSVVLDLPQQAAVMALARNPDVRYVSPDAPARPTSIDASQLKTTYEATIGTPQVWNAAVPATGAGVTVAVLDSGINQGLADFGGGVTCVKTNTSTTGCNDGYGHGTHVAGIIKGRDTLGRYIGVAPDSNLISVKISDDVGNSTTSDLVNGLQWAFDNRLTYNIKAVNLSVAGSVAQSYLTSPVAAAAEQLWLNGVVVVAAAGNNGTNANATWFAPGNDPFVITVGALDENLTSSPADDLLAFFSSRGTTQDGYYKPDLVAPGRKIVSTLASSSSTLATQYPDRIVDTNYFRLSGTSMSTPVVTGVVALVLQQYPSLTPNQVKWLLTSTASAYPGQADAAGVVNPIKALQAASGPLGLANQGVPVSNSVNATTGTVTTSASYWDASYWDASYWDAATFVATAID